MLATWLGYCYSCMKHINVWVMARELVHWANEAEDVYQKLVASGEYTRADSVQEKWDYLICLKFR